MFKKKKKSIELARAYLFLRKMNKIISIIAILINATLIAAMLNDNNIGILLFIPNLYICLVLYWKINRENVERKKKELIKRD